MQGKGKILLILMVLLPWCFTDSLASQVNIWARRTYKDGEFYQAHVRNGKNIDTYYRDDNNKQFTSRISAIRYARQVLNRQNKNPVKMDSNTDRSSNIKKDIETKEKAEAERQKNLKRVTPADIEDARNGVAIRKNLPPEVKSKTPIPRLFYRFFRPRTSGD